MDKIFLSLFNDFSASLIGALLFFCKITVKKDL